MKCEVLLIISFVCAFSEDVSFASIVHIGAMFEGKSKSEELAFQVALDMLNEHNYFDDYVLKPIFINMEPEEVINAKKGTITDITWDNPFSVLEQSCTILNRGVIGFFSLLSGDNANIVASVCDAKEIPVVQIALDTKSVQECCSINLFPHTPVLAKAFAGLITKLNWRNFTVIYEKQESLPKIMEMLTFFTHRNVFIRQLYLNENGDYITFLKEIRITRQVNFILDCTIDHLNDVLHQALQVGLMMNEYSYVILNLDMHTINLSPYQHSKTNITGFRLIDPINPEIIKLAEALHYKAIELGETDMENFSAHLTAWRVPTTAALLIDGVKLFYEVWRDHGNFWPKELHCNSSKTWEHGSTIFNYMKSKTYHGLTGTMAFDQRGFRTDFSLDIIELAEGGIIKVGTWKKNEGLLISRVLPAPEIINDEGSLMNMSFTIEVAVNHPYTMIKPISEAVSGNDQYEGFAIDIIKELANLEKFNYTLVRNVDDVNGNRNTTTNEWNGMIGDVMRREADLAIGDISITREREAYVDFTSPFMSLGVQILYKKPKMKSPSFFSFATPFAPEVWLLIGLTFFGMSLIFYLIARLCPSEWFNPYPCIEQPQYLINQYNITNCLWLIIANLMQQGADTAPRGVSTRVLASFWSFFILIMLSIYTANMAAFLTAEKEEWAFNDVKELVRRADKLGIQYGAVLDGATHKLFKDAEDGILKEVGEYMKAHSEHMVPWYDLGVEMVGEENRNYAFFMESSSIKYVIKQTCGLTSVGNNLDEKYYGIAMRKNSWYRNKLSTAVLRLSESGKLDELERKWWKKERGAPECVDQSHGSTALNYIHISGIIWITLVGIVASCLLVIFELAISIFKKYKRRSQRVKVLKEELRFYCKFEKMVKPSDLQEESVFVTTEPIPDNNT